MIAVSAVVITGIYHIMRKILDNNQIKDALYALVELLEIVDVTRRECLAALNLSMSDYEDVLLSCCAKNWVQNTS
jgi:predicted nucleic acid-binding protein